jgi:hypothetical protein
MNKALGLITRKLRVAAGNTALDRRDVVTAVALTMIGLLLARGWLNSGIPSRCVATGIPARVVKEL